MSDTAVARWVAPGEFMPQGVELPLAGAFMEPPSPDARLIESSVAGDRQAFELLVARHVGSLARHIAPRMPAHLSGILEVEDVIQQTLMQAFRDLNGFAPIGEHSFLAWLLSIADNRLVDLVREQNRQKRGGGHRRLAPGGGHPHELTWDLLDTIPSPAPPPQQDVVDREEILAMEREIERLPLDQRRAIELHCLQGWSLDATAIEMRKSTGAIRALIHRGKCALRTHLNLPRE